MQETTHSAPNKNLTVSVTR